MRPSHLLRTAGALAIAGALALGHALPASAHAGLIDSDPVQGAQLDAAPGRITFSFNEPVGNAAVAVTAPDGTSVTTSDVSAVDGTVTAAVADVDQRGTYSASYRVVSADGHPIEGTVRYEVAAGRTVTPSDGGTDADEGGFVHRHRTHLFWAILAIGVAIALLLEPLRGRDDADDA